MIQIALPGAQSETARITRILLKRPAEAFGNQRQLAEQWESLNYTACPDFERAVAEHERLVELLEFAGVEVLFFPAGNSLSIDSIYVRDSMAVTNKGVILCNMGKSARRDEPEAAAAFLQERSIPILGRITGSGSLEGGDLIWLDEKTLIVGQGYRTNAEGIRQLRELTADLVDEFVAVPLPHWTGPGGVMHLMSNISPIDNDLVLVYSRLLPVPFRDLLLERGVKLVEVPDEEYTSMGCNALAIAPRRCIMLEGNPETKRRLDKQGVEVLSYTGDEISRKGAGGPTCLTRPLERSGQ